MKKYKRFLWLMVWNTVYLNIIIERMARVTLDLYRDNNGQMSAARQEPLYDLFIGQVMFLIMDPRCNRYHIVRLEQLYELYSRWNPL